MPIRAGAALFPALIDTRIKSFERGDYIHAIDCRRCSSGDGCNKLDCENDFFFFFFVAFLQRACDVRLQRHFGLSVRIKTDLFD